MESREWMLVDGIVVESAVALFGEFGLEARHGNPLEEGQLLYGLTLAVVGFAGDQMRGSLLISAETGILARSHPANASERAPGSEELRDWSGELANLLLGRIKNRLLDHSVSMQLSTPTTLSGIDLRVGTSARNAFCLPHLFHTPDGVFQVRFEAVAQPETHLVAADANGAAAGSAGEVLLF